MFGIDGKQAVGNEKLCTVISEHDNFICSSETGYEHIPGKNAVGNNK